MTDETTQNSTDHKHLDSITFNISEDEIIRIDAQGFHYRQQFIEDAGEAHRLLVEFLRQQQEES